MTEGRSLVFGGCTGSGNFFREVVQKVLASGMS